MVSRNCNKESRIVNDYDRFRNTERERHNSIRGDKKVRGLHSFNPEIHTDIEEI